VSPLIDRPLRTYPLERNGHRKFLFLSPKSFEKIIFPGQAFTPSPLLMARPLEDELILRLP